MYSNKKILILGMARSGYEAAKYLSKLNNEVIVTDAKEQDIEKVKELESLGVKVVITSNQIDLVTDDLDYMIKNPGIKYTNECVLKANELGIKVINELELAYYFINKKAKIIGVTGSNGKTTTVTLIYNILKESGLNAYLGGNIGTPLISFVDEIKEDDILVLEISDHQLCDMYDFKTDISVLTNIYNEVHIDFHDSFERYQMMKKRIFNHHDNTSLAIINKENENSINLINDIESNKLYFSLNDGDSYVKDNFIYYKNEKVICLDDIKIKGNHNLENIMATILVTKQFNVTNEDIKNVLNTFKGVEHRIEYVRTLNGIDYYNDSKSTNNKATETALQSFKNPIILIMGGLNRNLPFDELSSFMSNVKEIVCYGETKEQIKEFALNNNIECFTFDTLKEATLKASSDAKSGDTILLSPACASWDQYKCFEDRGNEFKDIVNNL